MDDDLNVVHEDDLMHKQQGKENVFEFDDWVNIGTFFFGTASCKHTHPCNP